MEKILAEIKDGFKDFKIKNEEEMKNLNELVKANKDGNDAEMKAALEKAEKGAADITALADRMLEAEQKLVEGIKKGTEAPQSLGKLVIESDAYKDFASQKAKSMSVEFKNSTTTGQAGSPASNSNILVPAQRVPGIIPGAFRRLRISDLIPFGTTSSNAIEATRELAFTNNAVETAEGASKPETDITFELYTTPVVTIAHWLKVSKQIRDDAPALMSYINTRLSYGVDLREETQMIAGNGVGQNLIGMTNTVNRTLFTPTSGDNALDSINKAKYLVDAQDYQATAIVLNPTDWGAIERTKVGSSDLRYVVGDPHSALGPFLWGLPVVVTNSMTSGKLLVAAFDIAFMKWLREETNVSIYEQDDTNAQKNLLTIRAEKRMALAGYRAASVQYGDLTT